MLYEKTIFWLMFSWYDDLTVDLKRLNYVTAFRESTMYLFPSSALEVMVVLIFLFIVR